MYIRTLAAMMLTTLSAPLWAGVEGIEEVGDADSRAAVSQEEGSSISEETQNLEMDDARTRFLIWVGEPKQGLKRLDEALDNDPENLELQIVKADIDYRLGKVVAAYDRIVRLYRRAPDNPHVERLYHAIRASRQDSLSMKWEYDQPSTHTQTTFLQLRAEHVWDEKQRLGIRMDHVNLKSDSLFSADTGRNQSYAVTKNNGSVYYRYLDESGDEGGVELQTQLRHIGIKGDYKKWSPYGFHQVSLMTNNPYWQAEDAIANEYRRDGAVYESDYYLGYSLQSHWGLGIYRYHTKSIGNVAKGTWYRVGLDYKIPLRLTEKWLKSYTIMAHYEVKGEHYTEYSHVYTSTGGRYQPFALKNREVHRMIAEMPLINDNSHYRVNPFLGFGLNTHESGVGGLIYGVDAAYHYGYNCDVTLKLSRDFVKDNPRVGYIFALGATLRFF